MSAAVDAAAVALWVLESALQVEVVDGEIGRVGRGEQAVSKTDHNGAKVGSGGVEAIPDTGQSLGMASDGSEIGLDSAPTAVDAPDQALERTVRSTGFLKREEAAQRRLDFVERVGHAHAGWMQRAALVVGC
ncbi:MAG: hypothetical protein V2A73_03955 [Pseudomonadota bacterium]